MQYTTYRHLGLLTLLFVFLFSNEKILAQQKHYPITVVDTFTLYKKTQAPGFINTFSANALEKNNTYNHLVNHGANQELFFYSYEKELQFTDSFKIESMNKKVSQNTFLSNTQGYLIMNYQGVYQYNKANTIAWKIEAANDSTYFESILEVTDGYILSGGIVRNDSLFNTLYFIKTDGSIKWQKNFYLLQNSYISITQALTFYEEDIYFMYADSNQVRSIINGGNLIFSSVILKIDLSGNISDQNSLNISPRKFTVHNTGLFLFGDEIEVTSNNTLYRLYKIDTGNLSATGYFNNLGNTILPYGDNWLSISHKNVRSADKLKNQFLTTITLFKVVDTESITASYSTVYTDTLTDTLTRAVVPINNVQLDTDGNILMTFELVKKFISGPTGFLLYKFVLKKDTLPLYDSLWGVTDKVTLDQIRIDYQTLLPRTTAVFIQKKNDPTTLKKYIDKKEQISHTINFTATNGEYEYYVQSTGTIYNDTITSPTYFLTVGPNTGFSSIDAGGITIYPNPSNGTFVFEAPVPGNLMLYTMEGKVILNKNIQTTTPLDLSLYGMGIYVYQFCTNKSTLSGKIVIQQ